MSDGDRAEGLVMSDELVADADVVSLPGPRLSAAAYLLLMGEARQFLVQRAGGREVVAERFLNDYPLPAVPVTAMQQSGVMHLLDHLAKLAGRGRQI